MFNIRAVTKADYHNQKDERADKTLTLAWLRLLLANKPENHPIIGLSGLVNEADTVMGTDWFNQRYPDCPFYIAATRVTELTMTNLTKLGPRAKIIKSLSGCLNTYGNDKPSLVLFDSPVDGLPLMTAHVSTKVPVYSFQLATSIQDSVKDTLPMLDETTVIRLQPAVDVIKYITKVLNWGLYK